MTVPVSIVIPIHNGRDLLDRLLASIARQTATPLEIIVVDNASSDGAPETARNAGAQVIAMSCNAGFAKAVNRGIRQSNGDAIALINSDVELNPRWLETLWRALAPSDSAFATGKILAAESATLDGAYDLVCRGATAWRAGAGHPASALSSPAVIHFCSGTASLYRASLFHAIGLFEESFESYLEDVDLSLRAAAAGFTGLYVPDAVCSHLGSATFGRWSPQTVRLIARNQLCLVARHYPGQLILRWFWPILIAQLLWGALALRHGRFFAWLKGKTGAIISFGRIRREASPNPAVAPLIASAENQIRNLQSDAPDLYWKLYFRLTGRARA